MSIEKVHSGATVTLSQQGTCGGIFCVKVTLFVGECHFIQMPRLKKKRKEKALCCVHSFSLMNVCMFCKVLPLVACPFMQAKSPVPDHQHSTTLYPLWSDQCKTILLTTSTVHKSNPVFHLCVCHPVPWRGNLADLTSTNPCWCFLTHPPPELSIQIEWNRL